MRNSVLLLVVVALGLEAGSGSTQGGSPNSIDAGQIAELITRLGNTKFKERETATEALEAIGAPALGALEQAALSSDPEVGRRAQNLAQLIRRRIDAEQFLAPLRLRLLYKETPVLQAVEEFANQTKFPIEIGGSRVRLAGRKITLDTGTTSFWEAFDQFCQKAGLVERTPPVEVELQTTWAAARGRQRGVVQIVETPSASSSIRGWDGRLQLSDGKPPLLPTCHAGAVRIRALPARGSATRVGREEGLFLLEVTPQPKVLWHTIVDLRIDKAVDEDGQDLAPSLEWRNEWDLVALTTNVAMLWDAQNGRPVTTLRDIPVRLKPGAKPSGMLKEVKGVVAAQVETAAQAIITVDNIFNAAGRTFMSDDAESLKLVEANRQPNGDVQVRIELNDASSANAQWIMRRGVMRPRPVFANGMGRRGVIGEDSTAPPNVFLQDADGQSFPLRNREEDMVARGNRPTREISLTYRPGRGLGEPSKLVYSGRRTIVIEVPFALKDVPLR